MVFWPKRALVSAREVEQGVRAVRDLLFAVEGAVSSESDATGLIDIDTKESVVSSEAVESREEDVEVPSSAVESRGKVVHRPKRALVPFGRARAWFFSEPDAEELIGIDTIYDAVSSEAGDLG